MRPSPILLETDYTDFNENKSLKKHAQIHILHAEHIVISVEHKYEQN